jgi:DNA-directed RNA polymerase specialized sigma24 family protein
MGGVVVSALRARAHAGKTSLTSAEWLESPYLKRLAIRVGLQYALKGDDLEDLVQEVRIALWRANPQTTVGPAWIQRVAVHKAVDLVRSLLALRDHDRTLAVANARPALGEEIGHLLHARTASLPPPLSEFYDLHYRQGFSERAIALRLGVCRASVRWLDHRVRRVLFGPA